MITIVLSNRNRNLNIVKKCLDSLMMQSKTNFELFLIDYGSKSDYLATLEKLLTQYSKVKFIKCPVQGQLWNKSRAINIVLKQTVNPYFLVGDIDMIFKKDFFKTLESVKSPHQAIYFQVGFLSEEESQKNQFFEDYKVNHLSSVEATGITLFPTHILKSINGYDEFYHGWGAEDTDVHIRLRNLGIKIDFFEKEILLKHQWHPKTYRTNLSTDPYHFELERINHSYIQISQSSKQIKANINQQWGILPEQKEYSKLSNKPNFVIEIEPEISKVNALLAQLNSFENKVVSIIVKDTSRRNKNKQFIKRILGKKHQKFLSVKKVNNMILQEIVLHYRNLPYQYSFNQNEDLIHLKIYFR